MPHETNAELMQKVAEGDSEAFAHLYLRFAPVLSRFLARRGASPDLCDDLVQKIFADLWEKRADFRAQSSFETYLFGIAKNTLRKEKKRALDAMEKSRRNYRASPDQLWNDLSEPEAELYLEELRVAIERALGKLTPAQRQALESGNTSDIRLCKSSVELDCSHKDHKSCLKRARKKMRQLLAHILQDD